jgi:uncharacterized membrane protein HdeD (DUF308 family)
MVILGGLSILSPTVSGLAVVTVAAVLLIVAGIVQAIFAFRATSVGKGILRFLFGGLAILFGLLVFVEPILGLASVALLFGAFFLVDGIVDILAAVRAQGKDGWQWMIFSGVASVLLSVLMLAQWPLSGAWAVGILLGLWMILTGWSMITLGTSVGDAAQQIQDTRLDRFESHLRGLTDDVYLNQMDLTSCRIELLRLEKAVLGKVSPSDLDPALVELNQQLAETRAKVEEASKTAENEWTAVHKSVRAAFESLRKSVSEAIVDSPEKKT